MITSAAPQVDRRRTTPKRVGQATVALIGNPNAGKTTLFNALTGLRARTANYPGITVDWRKAVVRLEYGATNLIDLPGLYSLDAITPEERVAESVLRGRLDGEAAPDVVVLVMDATNLERNLFLAGQVLELGLPTVVALNLIDVARTSQISTDADQLALELQCPVVPVSARTGEGLEQLKAVLSKVMLEDGCGRADIDRSCTLGCSGCPFVDRYNWAEKVAADTSHTPASHGRRTEAIDRFLTQLLVGLAACLVVMMAVFYLIFYLAEVPMTLIGEGFAWAGTAVGRLIPAQASGGLIWSSVVFVAVWSVIALALRVAGRRLSWPTIAMATVGSLLVALMSPAGYSSSCRRFASCSCFYRCWKTAATWHVPHSSWNV
jgi:ferrous iron transport protein B